MFEWDALKEQSNITKHGLDFRTAARIFLDRFMIEFEDERDYVSLGAGIGNRVAISLIMPRTHCCV